MLDVLPRRAFRGRVLAMTALSVAVGIGTVLVAAGVLALSSGSPPKSAHARWAVGTRLPASSPYLLVFGDGWQRLIKGEQQRAAFCYVHFFRGTCLSTLTHERGVLLLMKGELDRVAVPTFAVVATAEFRHELVVYLRLTSRQAAAIGRGQIGRFREIARNHQEQICIGQINEAIEDPATDHTGAQSEALEPVTAEPIPQLPYASC